MTFSTEFQVNQVFAPREPNKFLTEPVRYLGRNSESALCIPLNSKSKKKGLIVVPIDAWMEFLYKDDPDLNVIDAYAWLPQLRNGLKLPPKAIERLIAFKKVQQNFVGKEILLFDNRLLLRFLEEQAVLSQPKKSLDTIRRWFFTWLRAGQNPLAIVESFLVNKPLARQQRGEKRGRKNPLLPSKTARPAYEFESSIKEIYQKVIKPKLCTWNDAYTVALTKNFGLTEEDAEVFFIDPTVAARYKVPGRQQFLKVLRRIKEEEDTGKEQPDRGHRGSARDYAPGPGFFEIDATYFQIQLISRSGARNIVSRPLVYLIVDIFSGVIVGYVVSLEEPSWAVAALALHNCFADKQQTFERLSLDFKSEDWPCHHLPTVLRADRAEFVSTMGQEFPKSTIRLEITPSYTAQAKGTVEGKNNEVKHKRHRIDLPGLYKKFRSRGETDGKWDAALNIDEFEKAIVEIIMLLNRQAVLKKHLPRDAIKDKVSTRLQLWTWGLANRSGYTARAPSNFVYEHLLAREVGSLKPTGIYYKNQRFNCDLLREFRYLQTAPDGGKAIELAINKNYAGELFFRGPENSWHCAYNDDIEVIEKKLSFRELLNESQEKGKLLEQGTLDATTHWSAREGAINRDIKAAKKEADEFRRLGGVSKNNIRESRSAERKSSRSPSFNGLLTSDHPPAPKLETPRPKVVPPARKALNFEEDEE